jgi:hypothetical protein
MKPFQFSTSANQRSESGPRGSLRAIHPDEIAEIRPISPSGEDDPTRSEVIFRRGGFSYCDEDFQALVDRWRDCLA